MRKPILSIQLFLYKILNTDWKINKLFIQSHGFLKLNLAIYQIETWQYGYFI